MGHSRQHHPPRAWAQAQHRVWGGCGAAGSVPKVGPAVTAAPAAAAWPSAVPAVPQEGDTPHPLAPAGPFEDALKLHECIAGGGTSPPIEDQWPSPPTRKAPIAPTEEQLRREPWYHGRMSRQDAERLLQADGDFLVRDSLTNPGQYVLTGMHSGQPKHLLLVDPEGVVRAGAWGAMGTGTRVCVEPPCRRQLLRVQDRCAPGPR